MLNHASELCKNLFGSAEGFTCTWSDVWVVHAKLFEDTRELSGLFSEEEISNVIDVMKTNRVAGVAGFLIEFFQTCCPFIKDEDDVMMCFVELILVSLFLFKKGLMLTRYIN